MAEITIDTKPMGLIWFLIAALVAIELGKLAVAKVAGAARLF